MPRYILIDNCSGYIWGDSADFAPGVDITDPIHAARCLDYDISDADDIERAAEVELEELDLLDDDHGVLLEDIVEYLTHWVDKERRFSAEEA